MDGLCPVITLENCEGKWAGVLRLMDDGPDVNPAQTIEVVAVSRGSCSYMKAALKYKETVDRLGCYKFELINDDYYHFVSSDSVPLTEETRRKICVGSRRSTRQPGAHRLTPCLPLSLKTENLSEIEGHCILWVNTTSIQVLGRNYQRRGVTIYMSSTMCSGWRPEIM